MDTASRAQFCLTRRNNVFDDHPAVFRHGADPDELTSGADSVYLAANLMVHLVAKEAAGADAFHTFHQLALGSVVELVKLREGTVQPNPAARGIGSVDQANGDKPLAPPPVPLPDDKLGDSVSHWVDDHTADLAAVTI